jgi:signal peptidase I
VSVATAPAEGPALVAPAQEGRRRRPRALVVVLAVVAIALVLRAFVAEPFSIPSDSMSPTLTRGDHVLVDKLAYRGGGEPRAGELVVFHAPGTGDIMLKRVVAVGGQTVGIEDGLLVVDGRKPREPYADADAIDSVFFGPVRVPEGSVFVLGDNRLDSKDSRSLGAVPADEVIGRARARIWPPSRWGGLARGG